jgi:lipopolysaccharide assembly protein A
MIFALIIGFVLGAAAILFILQNTAIVALSFLEWQFETSVALVVILSILVGIILALLMTLPGAIGSSFRLRKLRKHNEALAREAEAHKQAADQASARLVAAQTPDPDVLDLKS